MLSVKNLKVKIGEKEILKGIDFDFEPGKIYAVMGPNGSGKSTLAGSIMGNPAYELGEDSKIILKDEEIQETEPDERSEKGLFMSFQSPLALSGVTINNLLRYALDGKVKPIEIRKQVKEYAAKLGVNEDLLKRSLNEDFSGGEKKKMEVIQAAVMNPQILFFDEIDTGVDVDALKAITNFIQEMVEKDPSKTIIMITHYTRILKYLQPDNVLVIKNGELVKVGEYNLAETIEKEGYDAI